MSSIISDSSSGGKETKGAIESLLAEVKGLAIQMRKSRTVIHRPDGLPPRVWEVMQTLSVGGSRTVPQIAHLVMTSRQNVQMTVNRLRSEGWVEIVENTSHKRSGLVNLTQKGRAMVAAASQREEQFWGKLHANATPDQFGEAAALLRGLRLALSTKAGPTEERPTPHPRHGERGRISVSMPVTPPNASAWQEPPEETEFPVSLL